MGWRRPPLRLAALAPILAVGGYFLVGSLTGGGAQTFYLDPAGSDANQCSLSAPCASIGRGFAVMQGGDTLELADGIYPGQKLDATVTAKSTTVTIRAAHWQQAKVQGLLQIVPDRIHVEGLVGDSRSSLNIGSRAYTDLIVSGYEGMSFFGNGTGYTLERFDFGGFDACVKGNPDDAVQLWGISNQHGPDGVNFRNGAVHDVRSDTGPNTGDTCNGATNGKAGIHSDCVQTMGGVNLTIDSVVFYHCPADNLQSNPFAGATSRNIVVQNNFFGKTHCCNIVAFGDAGGNSGDCSTLVFRRNIVQGNSPNATGNNSCRTRGLTVTGNLFIGGQCADQHSVYTANIVSGGTCAGAKVCTPAWFSGSAPAGWSTAIGQAPDFRIPASDPCAGGIGPPTLTVTTPDTTTTATTAPPATTATATLPEIDTAAALAALRVALDEIRKVDRYLYLQSKLAAGKITQAQFDGTHIAESEQAVLRALGKLGG